MLTCKLILEGTPEEVASFLATPGAKALTALNLGGTTALTAPTNGGHDEYLAGIAARADDDNGPANTNAPPADTSGLPWDDRIHSRNKGLNADGTWRKKRGVDGAMVAAVEAELKMRSQPPGMPNATHVMPPQPNYTQPSSQVPMPHQQPQYHQQPQPMPNGQYMPPPNGMPNGQYTAPPAPAPAMDFTQFMQHLSEQMGKRDQNGQPLVTVDYLMSVVQRLTAQFGRQFNSITDVSGDPNAINAAVALITADGRWN